MDKDGLCWYGISSQGSAPPLGCDTLDTVLMGTFQHSWRVQACRVWGVAVAEDGGRSVFILYLWEIFNTMLLCSEPPGMPPELAKLRESEIHHDPGQCITSPRVSALHFFFSFLSGDSVRVGSSRSTHFFFTKKLSQCRPVSSRLYYICVTK